MVSSKACFISVSVTVTVCPMFYLIKLKCLHRPSDVVKAGGKQLAEWAKDSPAVSDANASHAYNKV